MGRDEMVVLLSDVRWCTLVGLPYMLRVRRRTLWILRIRTLVMLTCTLWY